MSERLGAELHGSVANAHRIAPFSVQVKANVAALDNCYSLGMPNFGLTSTVSGNVRALRVALGSAVRPLSLSDLARMISEQHPARRTLNGTTVGRWESGESEPDLASLHIMAKWAGVSMEQFAAVSHQHDGGKNGMATRVSGGGMMHRGMPEIDLSKPLTPAPDPRLGRAKAVKGTPVSSPKQKPAKATEAESPGKRRRPA